VKRILLLANLALAMTGAAFAQETSAPLPESPPPAPQWVGPEVTLQTTMGDIIITLDTVGAPKTAAQFLGLVKSGHYDGAIFFRIEPNFLLQLGDLDAKLEYRAPKLPPVELETATNRHTRGAVALAHGDDPNSGQSSFYIDMNENESLNATPGAAPNTTGYAVFGHVTAGMWVAEAIQTVELAPEGEQFAGKAPPFPGKLPKVPVVVNKAIVTKE
jgi:cyclophilin family peptidyl-prolyl cis-trans isomerase